MTSSESPKQVLFRNFASIAKAVGNPHRLELLEALAQGDDSVDSLAQRTGLTLANASHHLQQMRRVGLVEAHRDGKYVVYRLSNDRGVLALVHALAGLAERHLAEVQDVLKTYFDSRDHMEPVSREELLARMRAGTVQVLDVRPAEEFAQGHLPGAINIPLSKLKRMWARLDPTKDIVAYCRGPYCILSFEAVSLLRSKAFRARRLEEGLPEWRAAGLPVDVGTAATA